MIAITLTVTHGAGILAGMTRGDWKRAARRAAHHAGRRPLITNELAAWLIFGLLILAVIIGLWGGR